MAGTCGYGEELSGSINAGNFLTSCKVYWLVSQDGFCSMEQVNKYIGSVFGIPRKFFNSILVGGEITFVNTGIGSGLVPILYKISLRCTVYRNTNFYS